MCFWIGGIYRCILMSHIIPWSLFDEKWCSRHREQQYWPKWALTTSLIKNMFVLTQLGTRCWCSWIIRCVVMLHITSCFLFDDIWPACCQKWQCLLNESPPPIWSKYSSFSLKSACVLNVTGSVDESWCHSFPPSLCLTGFGPFTVENGTIYFLLLHLLSISIFVNHIFPELVIPLISVSPEVFELSEHAPTIHLLMWIIVHPVHPLPLLLLPPQQISWPNFTWTVYPSRLTHS